MSYYDVICQELQHGILLEDRKTIQEKMIELSKIDDVEAMKCLYLLIRLQKLSTTDSWSRIYTSLDYQSDLDQSTVCINLSNNTVKQAYRLLEWILDSFYIDPNLYDDRNGTMYGYIMAHLLGIYQSDNNFHSRGDLEKIMVKISKQICQLYPIDIDAVCYQTQKGNLKTYAQLIHRYSKKIHIIWISGILVISFKIWMISFPI